MTSANGLTIPQVTIKTLITQARSLLMDPSLTPIVPSDGGVNTTLQDVRVRGRGAGSSANIGTVNWVAGSTGWPWAILSATYKKVAIKESGRQWEDWRGWLHLGLTPQINGQNDPWDWAADWDAALTQFIALHRGLGMVTGVQLGDVHWTLEASELRPLVENGISAFGVVMQLTIHNVVPVTYGR